MHALSEQECQEWCLANRFDLDRFRHPAIVKTTQAEPFRIPEDTGRRIALVNGHLGWFREADPVLVWIAEWGVWPSSERPHVFDRFRQSYGVYQSLSEKCGHVFSAQEFDDALSFVTLAVLFLWDCYVLTPTPTIAIWYSHDEIGYTFGMNEGDPP